MLISFANKAALVTGAGRGIGRQLVKSLVSSGAQKVYALCQLKDDLLSLRQEVANVETFHVDLTDWEATRRIVAGLGQIDCLVNNAGYVDLAPVGSVTSANFDKHFDINVKAVVNVTQLVTEKMILSGRGGSVVNVASAASTTALKDHLSYCSSKAAVNQLTRVFALELGPHSIRVNSVNPTVVMTDMGKKAWSDPQKSAEVLKRIPLGRFAQVEDVVNAILFLLSDKANMINGAVLAVDGGYSAC